MGDARDLGTSRGSALGALFALTAALSLGCRGAESPSQAHAPPPQGMRGAWSYEATLAPFAKTIDVTATFAPGTASELTVTEGAEPFVDDVAVRVGESWRAVPPRGASWFVPSCEGEGCVVRYRFALAEAARVLGDESTARRFGDGAFEATPPTWLLHPLELPRDATFRLRVHTTPPDVFATGLTRATPSAKAPPGTPDDADVYEASVESLPFAPYSALGRYRVRDVVVPKSERGGGATIRMAIGPGDLKTTPDDLAAWLTRAASAVRDYYGMFPIDGVLVVLLPHGRRHVGFGRTMAGGGGSILIDVGQASEPSDLKDDWVAVHEMIHLAFPSVPRDSLWIEEGLATYLEPIIRARAGMLDPSAVWEQFVGMMHNGLPEPGDQGLERTHTWGRVYWGGALFCLVADVMIREATHGERSLDDAVRGILAAGGNDAARWTTAHAFDVGDAATRTHVLSDLYARMGLAPGTVDLDGLFAKLGVEATNRGFLTDDDAPLAHVRHDITRH